MPREPCRAAPRGAMPCRAVPCRAVDDGYAKNMYACMCVYIYIYIYIYICNICIHITYNAAMLIVAVCLRPFLPVCRKEITVILPLEARTPKPVFPYSSPGAMTHTYIYMAHPSICTMTHIYIYMYVHLSLSLSIYIYIYIHISLSVYIYI